MLQREESLTGVVRVRCCKGVRYRHDGKQGERVEAGRVMGREWRQDGCVGGRQAGWVCGWVDQSDGCAVEKV
ncbi:hypothetical protein E2C01_078452 [Portunus trituberculatus]|uniref:Uncharacterized protein n=1 Tax=Portunus trituberculatus TaxID=210409 RepID=A0A5B7IQ69_PORTR|nr:hypothetical protein [Portunus trituberculatus]